MAQDSEDEVWEQILINANQLSFPEWDLFPEDSKSEKITQEKEEVDSAYCSCDNRQEVKQQILNDVFYVCSNSNGKNGCGKEIKKSGLT